MNHDALVKAALAGLLALGAQPIAAQQEELLERCWGAARAGQNACDTKQSANACVRMSLTDYDPDHYRVVKKGTCIEIGGSLEQGVPGRLAKEKMARERRGK